jgi:ABC-type lipoprotein release transport system permease subunit
MALGLWGGIIGFLGGFIAGKLIGLVLSFFSIFKGQGIIDITNLPFVFVLFIIMLSLTVEVLTGIFPAKRATSISALDALRYE